MCLCAPLWFNPVYLRKMNTKFKLAEIADIEFLLEMISEFYALEQISFDEKVARSALSQLIENEFFGCVWLLQNEVETIGYVALIFGFSLEYGGRDALIDELYLRENFRGQGFGTDAIKFVENFCRENDIKALHLEVSHHNAKARALYERLKFVDYERYFLTKELRNNL